MVASTIFSLFKMRSKTHKAQNTHDIDKAKKFNRVIYL